MVRYKLQTFIRVVFPALDIGAGSGLAFVSSRGAGVITGRIVERDSGKRRVRKRVEACLYILEIWEEACRELKEERDDIEEVRRVELVGLRVVAKEPFVVMMDNSVKRRT